MAELVPAIIARHFAEVESKLARLEPLTAWAHLDVADGRFAAPISWHWANDLDFVAGRIKLEVHLMVAEPEASLSDWVNVADRVIVHAEAAQDLNDLVEVFDGHHTKLGIGLLLETPLERLAPYWSRINFVHLLSVAELGAHGRPFAPLVLNKIKALRQAAPHVTISVDGGINLTNAPEVVAAGADRLVVGGAIWHAPEPEAAVASFQQLLASLPPR